MTYSSINEVDKVVNGLDRMFKHNEKYQPWHHTNVWCEDHFDLDESQVLQTDGSRAAWQHNLDIEFLLFTCDIGGLRYVDREKTILADDGWNVTHDWSHGFNFDTRIILLNDEETYADG